MKKKSLVGPSLIFTRLKIANLEFLKRVLKIAARTGRFEIEGWRVRKDGTRFWALAVIDAVRNEAGELLGFAKITRDLTERQFAQQSLFESERRYRQLIEAVTDYAIYQLDANGLSRNLEPRCGTDQRL